MRSEDRCAHRQVKLSLGRVKGCLQPRVHVPAGEFDRDGN
jgi:phenylpropionate dioxygenase-like ring-hydroxylating dioxygenase large terminal subunit